MRINELLYLVLIERKNEIMEKMIRDVEGNFFKADVSNLIDITVLAAGYIITPDGEFIGIEDDEDHGDKFSCYLREYLKDNRFVGLITFDAALYLTQLGHIVYFGIKMEDMSGVYFQKSGSTKGLAVLYLPDDLDVITSEQKQAVVKLLNTNKPIFGNHPIIELVFYTIGNLNPISEEELREFCNCFKEDRTR